MFPDPVIFGTQIQWYSLWQYIAIVTTIVFAFGYLYFRKPLSIAPVKIGLTVLILLILGYLGARLFSALDNLTDKGMWTFWDVLFDGLNHGRLRWYGALLFVLAAAPLIARLLKIKDWLNGMDVVALALCLFTAIVKQACFFSGDGCYGIYTNLPWGMYFPYGPAPNILPVHPTPLYDSIFHFGLFLLLYRLNQPKIKRYSGQVLIVFFMATSIFNILLEFIRINPVVALGLTLSQITYIVILFITFGYYWIFRNQGSYQLLARPVAK